MKKALILILALSLLLGGCGAPSVPEESPAAAPATEAPMTEMAPETEATEAAVPQGPVEPISIEIDTTYDTYDLTGDGEADTLLIQCLQPGEYWGEGWGDFGYHWQLLVNGAPAMELKTDWPIRPETELYQVSDGRVYLAIRQQLDTNDDIADYGLYQYAAGSLEQVCDFYCDQLGSRHIFHYGAELLSLAGDRIVLRCHNQFNATAYMFWDMEFEYRDGLWQLLDNVYPLVYEEYMEDKADGMTANQTLTVYTGLDCTEAAYTVPKGGVLFFHQICMSGEDVLFQVTNQDGQLGWLKDPEEVYSVIDGQELFGCFEEARFAG